MDSFKRWIGGFFYRNTRLLYFGLGITVGRALIFLEYLGESLSYVLADVATYGFIFVGLVLIWDKVASLLEIRSPKDAQKDE